MRTSSEPARAREAICWMVDSTSAVSVLVIDWTTTGASDPTRMPPMLTVTARRRWIDGMCSFYQSGRVKPRWQRPEKMLVEGNRCTHGALLTSHGREPCNRAVNEVINHEVAAESDE